MEECDTRENSAFGMVREEKVLNELHVGNVSCTMLVLLHAVSHSRPFVTFGCTAGDVGRGGGVGLGGESSGSA